MTLLFIYKKLLSLPILIPIEGAIRKILLSQKQENKTNLREAKERETGQASEVGASREKLKLVSVNVEWQAAPGVMSCTR